MNNNKKPNKKSKVSKTIFMYGLVNKKTGKLLNNDCYYNYPLLANKRIDVKCYKEIQNLDSAEIVKLKIDFTVL